MSEMMTEVSAEEAGLSFWSASREEAALSNVAKMRSFEKPKFSTKD